MSDKLVFDLAQEVEGTPNVFVRKDWINILDNQNQNYNNNQSVIDTSQLSNSNKYMSYRESYFLMPLVLTLASNGDPVRANTGGATATVTDADFIAGDGAAINYYFTPQIATQAAPATQTGKGCDYSIGLKNWFGQIIHSFTLDYNGTTIIQQTPYVNMWNSFKLLTSLSYQDILTQGAQIGFYPDTPDTFTFCQSQALAAPVLIAESSLAGSGTCNNSTTIKPTTTYGSFTGAPFPYVAPAAGAINNVPLSMNNLSSGCGNTGFVSRMKNINFDSCGLFDFGILATGAGGVSSTYINPQITTASFFNGGAVGASITSVNQLWKSYIYNKVNAIAGTNGVWQCAIMATIYLKHVHSFFNMCPLLKGVFMKMTMNLNNSTTQFVCVSNYSSLVTDTRLALVPTYMSLSAGTTVPVGGVNPVMISSAQCSTSLTTAANVQTLNFGANLTVGGAGETFTAEPMNGAVPLFPLGTSHTLAGAAIATNNGSVSQNYYANISVGGRCINNAVAPANVLQASPLSQSVYLYIPAYTFNPVFEQAYLSSPVKQIKYTDIYQYQVLNIPAGGPFNNLITNGIANIKSVLIIPYYSSTGPAGTTGLPAAVGNLPVFQSPFDTAGTGTTSPFIALTNFNIQVSGQNAIYNVQRYNFEEWNNQLYGQNAVNGGLTDGLTSGLIDRAGFDSSYGYYYVNVERMLPVEQSVPKSIQILGQNLSSRNIDLYVFIEYGVDISIDALTGARV